MKRLFSRPTFLLSLFTGMLMSTSSVPLARAQADLVVHNARIYTVNPDQPQAQALAVRGERVLMVGSNDEVLSAYPDAERVDAGGNAVVPGLIDAHAHVMSQGHSMMEVDLVGTTSKADVLQRLEDFAAKLPDGAWLTGRGWDQNDWPEKVFPTRQDLDGAFPRRPVWLTRIDGHATWANTAAMNVVGLEQLAAMSDPEGGKIVRTAQGEPTGVFVDEAMALVGNNVPPPTDAENEQALRLALGEMARYGMTGVHDAGIGWSTIQLYERAIDEGWFTVRLYGMASSHSDAFDRLCQDGLIYGYGDRLTVRAVKFYIDGALGSRGAALLAPYDDDPGNVGLLRHEPEAFTDDVRKALECGFQVNTHAIGDRGNRVVLDALEHAMAETGNTLGRHRIEHAQVVALDDIPRFAQLGIIASMQPTHATSDMYWAEDRIGHERAKGAYAWRRFLDAGVPLAFGSDFPVEHVDPLLGFYAAITRQDAEGWPEGGWFPDQRLTRQETLRAFTIGAAYASFQEDELGSLEPGKFADFVILDHDIMQVPPAQILDTRVIATYVGGKPVYER